MIFFVMLNVAGRGYDMVHAEADTAEQASNKAVNFIKRTVGVNAEVAACSLALRQNRKRYSFPSSIL